MYTDTFRSLRFISCSELKQECLLFSELVNIYDAWAWHCLICTTVGLAYLISSVAKKESFVKSMLGMFKVVVGQGDPFMHHVFNSVPLRFAAVPFLFMGVIVSEGYKNSNMYNIICPRRTIFKEYISELVSGKFTVYTRSSVVNFFTYDDEFGNPEDIVFLLEKHILLAPEIVLVRSEVNFGQVHEELSNLSSLLPLLPSAIRQVVLKNKDWFPHQIFKRFFLKAAKKGNILENPELIFEKMANATLRPNDLPGSQLFILLEIMKRWEEGLMCAQ